MVIDTSQITGYAEMSAEDKIKALESFDVQPSSDDAEIKKYKSLVSKANSEAADYKKQLHERMTAEEKAAAEREEAEKEREAQNAKRDEEYKNTLRELGIIKYTNKYLALGYSEELAAETAKAQYDGDTDKVFENMTKFNAENEKKILAKLVDNTPGANGAAGGSGGDTQDVEIAKRLGKTAASNQNAAQDILSKYAKK